jgi:hypothetical protein
MSWLWRSTPESRPQSAFEKMDEKRYVTRLCQITAVAQAGSEEELKNR